MKKSERTEFSPRSTASILREQKVLEQIARVDNQIAHTVGKIEKNKRSKQSMLCHFSSGGRSGLDTITFDRITGELADFQRRKTSLEQFKAELEHTLEAERAIVPGRAEVQAQVAALAGERIEHDAQVERHVEELRAALDSRAALTGQMRDLAAKIEFSADLDEERFTRFAASLPSILDESKRRMDALLGMPGSVRAVARVRLERPETLRSTGIILAGQEMLLRQEEFDELSRTDVPKPGRYSGAFKDSGQEPWCLLPQQVCSIEQFEADKAEAERSGQTVEQIWRRQDEEREAESQKRYLAWHEAQQLEKRAIELSEHFSPPMPIEVAREIAGKFPGMSSLDIVVQRRAEIDQAMAQRRNA